MIPKNPFLLFLSGLLIIGCEKNQPEEKANRISEMLQYDIYGQRKTEYFYDGDNLVQRKGYFHSDPGGWHQDAIIDIEYVDEQVIETYSRSVNGEWTLDSRRLHFWQNGLYVKQLYEIRRGEEWYRIWTYDFSYEGQQLVEYERFEDHKEGRVPTFRQEYLYEDGKISEVRGYISYNGDWSLSKLLEFEYQGDKIASCVTSVAGEMSEPVPENRMEYSYTGEYLTTVEHHSWNASALDWEIGIRVSVEYFYGPEGNLAGMKQSNGIEELYLLEQGRGNASDFRFFPDHELLGFPVY